MKPDLEEGATPGTPRTTPVGAPPFFGGAAAGASGVPHGQGPPPAAAASPSVLSSTSSMLGIGRLGKLWKGKAKDSANMEDLLDPLSFLQEQTVTTYEAEDLTGWNAMTMYAGTVFTQKVTVRIIALQLGTCWSVAYTLFYFTSHPEHYRTDAVDEIIKTISISIAFMLGLFLNTCLQKWWDTVEGVQQLLQAVKHLVVCAIQHEVRAELRSTLCRRAMLSVRLLQAETSYNKLVMQKEAADQALMGCLAPVVKIDPATFWEDAFAELLEEGKVTQEEMDVLLEVPVNQRSFFAWSLVGSELRRNRSTLRNPDGVEDTFAYDRLCELVEAGVSGVSCIKSLGLWQLPFVYVHMLAFMVHFVNFCTAAGTGCSLGVMVATASARNEVLDSSVVISKMLYIVVQAFIYQAFLSIGTALSFPLSGTTYSIPLGEEINALDGQLYLINKMVDAPAQFARSAAVKSPPRMSMRASVSLSAAAAAAAAEHARAKER